MPNNYDAAAWFYDSLSRLVFGDEIINAQRFLLKQLSAEKNILIIGGGTGQVLEELASLHEAALKITYVEISEKMLRLSKQRNCGQHEVDFVHLPVEDYRIKQPFDVILTPFLFDNFTETHLSQVFKQLHQGLKPGGLFLICDFQVENNTSGIWQKIILQTMYWFFGWLCRVEAKKLISMEPYFKAESYTLLTQKTFYKGFILAQVYKK